MADVTEQIVALERGLWESKGAGAYEETLDQNVVIVMEPSGFLDRASAINLAQHAGGFTEVQFHDVRVQQHTPECATIVYHGAATSPEGKPQRSSVASTYVRRGERWRLALTVHQPWQQNGT